MAADCLACCVVSFTVEGAGVVVDVVTPTVVASGVVSSGVTVAFRRSAVRDSLESGGAVLVMSTSPVDGALVGADVVGVPDDVGAFVSVL